jgi:TusA-related sulfurtransferase
MKIYEVKGPCPELAVVLSRVAAEAAPGEVVKILSRWRYVVNDVKNSAKYTGLEVVEIREGSQVEIVVRKSAQAPPLLQGRET